MRFLYTVKKDVTVDKKYIKDLPSEVVDYGGLSFMIFEFPSEVGSYNRDCTRYWQRVPLPNPLWDFAD